MTGTILRLGPGRKFCFIGALGREWFAHLSDFPDPSIMKKGMTVSCTPKLAAIPGKPHPVTDVIAA